MAKDKMNQSEKRDKGYKLKTKDTFKVFVSYLETTYRIIYYL